MNWWLLGVSLGVAVLFLSGIRIVEQTERGLKERFGKYVGYCDPGFQWVIPLVETIRSVNVTEWCEQ